MTQFFSKGFEFIDFEPTLSIANRAKEKFGRIFGESPSDSTTQAIVRKTRKGFEGRMRICSAVGTFVADVMGEDPLEVIDALSHKIRAELRIWKSRRALLGDAI